MMDGTNHPQDSADPGAIAIVGMAGRFPGAADIAAFRRMLFEGGLGIQRLGPRDADPRLAAEPGYVPARGVLEGADLFDAALFGIAPRDAAMMDPQQRIFLECCWTALEDAGRAPQGPDCATAGLFASASMATHWLAAAAWSGLSGIGGVAAVDKDLLTGRVAYHLGLGGPTIGVQTACSSSLVAVHMAVQALIAGECDMALAGGVSVTVPLRMGYLHQPGGVSSPDGTCRPFTAAGEGTVKGDGTGVVVLRRLADALADGDDIRAVILGSAVTNDGRARAGFAAPGMVGQARVVRLALQLAGVAPDEIGYVEGHGTATQVGDAIELRALAETFGRGGSTGEPPVLGAAKAHIGHLDAAAGVAGLIKTVLALQEGTIPPALYPGPPHPDLAASGFVLAETTRPWPRRSGPRRAGVSAFGLGGTNAHVVLEQAPPRPPRPASSGPHQLILTARTREGLSELNASMRGWLTARPETELDDLAFTLAHGRTPQPSHRIVIASTVAEAIRALSAPLPDHPEDITWPTPSAGRRFAAPTTPFEKVRHWLDTPNDQLAPADQLLVAGWRNQHPTMAKPRGPWLVMAVGRRGASLADGLRQSGQTVEVIEHPDDIPALAARGFRPAHLLHATALGDPPPSQDHGVIGLPAWVQALGVAGWLEGATLLIATTQAVAVGGERRLYPEHAGLTAVPATLMAEHPGLRCGCVDLGTTEDSAVRLLSEAAAEAPLVAYRHGRRWVRDWQPLPAAPASPPRQEGVWLITGGTGGIGLLLARHLARTARARLVLAGRTTDRPELAAAISDITALGGTAEAVFADLTQPDAADRLVRLALDRFGALHGVIHAAGLSDGGMVQGLTPDAVLAHHAVKPMAGMALAEALAGRPLDRFVLCGSHAGAFGAFGQYGYATANAALAGVAETLCATGRRETVAVHWDRWQGIGMAIQGEARHQQMTGTPLPGGLSPDAALVLFDRVLAAPPGEAVLLATSRPVTALVAERQGTAPSPPVAPPAARQPRPAGLPAPTPPTTASEAALVALWEDELGLAPIGIDDDFVSLGGDSLNALRVCGSANGRLGVVLPLRLLLEARTIAVLAERLGETEAPPIAGFAEELL